MIGRRTHLADVGLGDGDLTELLHGSHAVQQPVVEVDVDHHRTVLHLSPRVEEPTHQDRRDMVGVSNQGPGDASPMNSVVEKSLYLKTTEFSTKPPVIKSLVTILSGKPFADTLRLLTYHIIAWHRVVSVTPRHSQH